MYLSVSLKYFSLILGVFFQRLFISLVFILCVTGSALAQVIDVEEEGPREERSGSSILDDSTKQVYGPTTSRYTYQRNIKFNNPQYFAIDTSVLDLHKYQYVVKKERLYTNLGNIGTPSNSIYPLLQQNIGATSGYDIFDLYWKGPDEIKYYDTKSPYSSFKIIWGGQGRAITDVNYAINVDERSGFGFNYRGLFIDKQIQRTGRGDRNVRSTYYTLFGNYATRDGRYRVLASFIRNNHLVNEYGGILTEVGAIPEYFDENRQLSLTEAKNNELRTNYHLYHQYKLNNLIQFYHEYDRYNQQNDFLNGFEDNPEYFDFVEVDTIKNVKDRSKIVYRQHELGLKGDIGKTFYSFYYKYRDVDFRYRHLNVDTINSVDSNIGESYGGADIRFGNDSVSFVRGYAEYQQGGNFKIGGELRNSWISVNGETQQHAPAYIYQAYRGTYDLWVNDFKSAINTKVHASLNLDFGPLTIKPGVANMLLSNYLYFEKDTTASTDGQSVLPKQASSDINVLSPELGIEVKFLKKFTFKSHTIYNNVGGGSASAVRLPDLYTRAQLYYGDISFDGNLQWNIGFDAYWKSTYFANGYDPAIMQFYVQNDFEVESFPLIDMYFDAKINRGRFFLKLNNIYEIFSDIGYFATPEYPGQTTILDFGFDWSFYD